MEIRIQKEYHPVLETLGLAYLHKNFSTVKAEMMTQLSDLDSDGAGFYQTHLRDWEAYVESFGQRYVCAPCEDFFLGNDTEFFLTVLQLFLEDPDLMTAVGQLEEGALRARLSPLLHPDGQVHPLDRQEDRFALVAGTGLSEQTKWKLLLLLETPQVRLSEWAAFYERNRAAWRYALEANRSALDTLLQNAPDTVTPAAAEILPKVTEGPVTVYPTAAFPLSEWILTSVAFQGVLTARLVTYRQGVQQARQALPVLLKCLGDKSKFEILCSLKERGKYNLELAEDVHLSPATVSHHMGMLLANQLVTVEKQGGKVYYQLNQEPIRALLRGIADVLL